MTLNVFFVGSPNGYNTFIEALNGISKYRFRITDDLPSANIVFFMGGEDISPSIYKEPKLKVTNSSLSRDKEELKVYSETGNDQIKVGICRGAQLLCAITGGRIWQDVDGHAEGELHSVEDLDTGEVFQVNSTHHQMMRLGRRHELLAAAKESTQKTSSKAVYHFTVDYDPEVVVTENRKHLMFQPHPEYGHEETTRLFVRYLEHCIEYKPKPPVANQAAQTEQHHYYYYGDM